MATEFCTVTLNVYKALLWNLFVSPFWHLEVSPRVFENLYTPALEGLIIIYRLMTLI